MTIGSLLFISAVLSSFPGGRTRRLCSAERTLPIKITSSIKQRHKSLAVAHSRRFFQPRRWQYLTSIPMYFKLVRLLGPWTDGYLSAIYAQSGSSLITSLPDSSVCSTMGEPSLIGKAGPEKAHRLVCFLAGLNRSFL